MQMLNFILITLKYFGSNENAENVQSQISFFNIEDFKKKKNKWCPIRYFQAQQWMDFSINP